MSEDELRGFKKALKLLDDFNTWYKQKGDLSDDFLMGFGQAENLLYFEIEMIEGRDIF